MASNYTDKPESQEQTVIAIASDKKMYLNAKFIEDTDLGTTVEELLKSKTEKIVLIRADEEVDYSAVMAAMDQLRQAGVEDIGLITDRKNVPGGGGN